MLAVPGEHGLVGGDHMLAGGERGERGGLGRAVLAPHRLDHQIDVVAAGERDRVVLPGVGGEVDAAVAVARAGGDRGDLDGPSGAPGEQVGMRLDDLHDAGAHRAEAGEGDAQGIGHGRFLGAESAGGSAIAAGD
jgi:hypothetical protein